MDCAPAPVGAVVSTESVTSAEHDAVVAGLITALSGVLPAFEAVGRDLEAALDIMGGAMADLKRCGHCGAALEPKVMPSTGRLESPSMFMRRRYCDRACAGAARRKSDTVVPAVQTCQRCGAEFERQYTEGAARFAKRRYCSHDCSLTAVNSKRRDRTKQPRKAIKKPAPRPPRSPQQPVTVRTEAAPAPATKRVTVRQQHQTIRMQAIGNPCPLHPSYVINAWGQCAACVTGDRWAARQREIKLRPHPEGGR